MKKALPRVLVAVAVTALFVDSQAMAQSVPRQHTTDPMVEGLPSGDTAVPDAIFPHQMDDDLLIDNGLWQGALVGPYCAICGGGSDCPPDWYMEQGVRLLGRTRPRRIELGGEAIGSEFDIQLTNRTASPDVSLAYATTIGHYFARDRLNRDHFVEFTFWGLNGWKDRAQINGQRVVDSSSEPPDILEYGSLYSAFAINGNFLNGFDRADSLSTYYASYNNNFEINGRIIPRGRKDRLVLHPDGKWRRECQPGRYISYLYGLRFMQIHETFRFHGVGTTNTYDEFGTLIDTQTYTGDYDVATHNNLLGLQFGADMTFRQCRWSWGIRAKLGPYINFSDQVSGITSSPEATTRLAASKHEASLLGELGFMAAWKFRPNLMGRVAYDFIWVTGLALAPEQLQFDVNPVNRINNNGTIFYHGVSLGLEWLW